MSELFKSIKEQVETGKYVEQDDVRHFQQFNWITEKDIIQRILIERSVIRKTIRDILASHGETYSISVYDGEQIAISKSRDIDLIMDNIGQCDEEWLHVFAGERKLGYVYLVYGNDGWDVLADSSANAELVSLMTGAEQLSEELCDALYE